MLDKNAKIYVAGHRGLVGSAIWKNLQDKGYTKTFAEHSVKLGNKCRGVMSFSYKVRF